MKKLVAIFIALSVLSVSCAPKANCGSKRQHKARYKRMKSFAPGMAY